MCIMHDNLFIFKKKKIKNYVKSILISTKTLQVSAGNIGNGLYIFKPLL